MEHAIAVEFDDRPSLGDLIEATTRMHDAGAPHDAEIVLRMGDKGNQRDPWPYLRGFTAKWEK